MGFTVQNIPSVYEIRPFSDFWYISTQNQRRVLYEEGPTHHDPGIKSTGIKREKFPIQGQGPI